MSFEHLTVKAREVIEQAVADAKERGHQQVDCLHLCVGLLRQRDGVVPLVLEKMGVSVYPLIQKIEEALGGYYQVQGARGEAHFSYVGTKGGASVKLLKNILYNR